MQNWNWLTSLSKLPILLILFKHIMNHLLFACTISSTNSQYKGLAILHCQLTVYFFEFLKNGWLFISFKWCGCLIAALLTFWVASLHILINDYWIKINIKFQFSLPALKIIEAWPSQAMLPHHMLSCYLRIAINLFFILSLFAIILVHFYTFFLYLPKIFSLIHPHLRQYFSQYGPSMWM